MRKFISLVSLFTLILTLPAIAEETEVKESKKPNNEFIASGLEAIASSAGLFLEVDQPLPEACNGAGSPYLHIMPSNIPALTMVSADIYARYVFRVSYNAQNQDCIATLVTKSKRLEKQRSKPRKPHQR